MDIAEKTEFISRLSTTVLDKIQAAIISGKIPEDWDGHELRQYMADKFADAAYIKMPNSRKREYNNTILINNL